ncbi:DUF4198 domain-containing protein [Aestuariibacter sp. A3R04]|uniref:DUF4198 domain-containing protein n=1 Tax=Aestuariibacter sp. A3R04 TaxID=2841571 RepID=UPI001C0831B4|nr:DUF4198 domain-containing protein [Aestuariibacter sp. A3R04]MBU3021949.1 DUF4198 domain-containing protein [Aestuariibacter sp. A3R04]
MNKKIFFTTGVLLLVSTLSHAHVPYLKPLSFEPAGRDMITLDASFAEQFFVPEVAISKALFDVVAPDGVKSDVETVVNLTTRNVLEHELDQNGTYRFSTGNRKGAIFRVYELNGERGSVRGNDEPLPEGAELKSHFQSVTSAVTYVTKKGPTNQALKATGVGLEMVPETHPNSLFTGDTFTFTLTYDGVPVPNHDITLYQGHDQFSEESDSQNLTSDNNGKVSVTLLTQGVYLVMARLRADSPEGAPVPAYSYTTTLTIEAF